MMNPGLSVVVVAHNESKYLPQWFENIGWADEIILIDSGSVDNTAEVARKYTDKVISVPNRLNFDINKNIGFSNASKAWILSLDVDEYLTKELMLEIQSVIQDSTCSYAGFSIPFRTFYFGQEVPFKERHVRLFKNGNGSFLEDTVHQRIQIDGSTGYLNGFVLHYTDTSIYQRVQKSNTYSECMAAYLYQRGSPFRRRDLIMQPVIHFIKRYLKRGEYRQGVMGFINSVNGSYSVFLRYAKLWHAYERGHFISPDDPFPVWHR